MNARRKTITHEDIQRALRAFRKQGRVITRLPDEITLPAVTVGARWNAFETDADGIVPAGEKPA
jgi:hypothetical protein